MSYLLARTTPDELLLMIAAEDGETRPEPYSRLPGMTDEQFAATQHRPPVRARGFCWLNMTDNLYRLYSTGHLVESRMQGHVVHLSWKGWDRVEELLAAGATLPTEDERDEYGRRALMVVEGGDCGDLIPLDVPNPRGLEPTAPKRRWRRLLGGRAA